MQRTFYVQNGGQPGHGSAWKNDEANRLTNDFFKNILPVMENGYVRPRYSGYLHFQDHAGSPLQQCLLEQADPVKALNEMNKMYRQSLSHKNLNPA
jgi:multiple sugar transport system substrate-binding protein